MCAGRKRIPPTRVSHYNKQGKRTARFPLHSGFSPLLFRGMLPLRPLIAERKEKSMNRTPKSEYSRLDLRITPKEKERISAKAGRCGLSTTEYVKQRALGYEPRAVPPDALFHLLEKLGELEGKASSPELDEEISELLKEITAAFLLPGKEDLKQWQLQDSGQSVGI